MHHVKHAVVEHVLAGLRDAATRPEEFRRLARRVACLLIAEATRDLPVADGTVATPLESTAVKRLAAPVVSVPILRAGLGMLEPFLEIVPEAQVGYMGLERNEETAVARCYYEKVPKGLD